MENYSYRSALAQLQAAQKPNAGVPLYLRYVNRPLGKRLAALAAVIGLTPNQVTLASVACSLIGLGLIAALNPTWVVVFAAVLVLVAAYALDSADGQLARLTKSGGPGGEWLDHVSDAARIPLFHFAIVVSLYRFGEVAAGWLLVPLVFTVVASTRFFALILAEQLRKAYAADHPAVPENSGRLRSLLQLPGDLGVLNLVLLVLPMTSAFLVVYAILAFLNACLGALSLIRKYRETNSWNRSTQS